MTCALCQRDIPLTFHHLVPRTLHSRKWFKKTFSKEELSSGIDVCCDCHDAIHRFIPEKLLGTNYNTLDKLLSHDKVSNFVRWVSTKGGTHSTTQPAWFNRT